MKPMIEFCSGNCHTGIEKLLQNDDIQAQYEVLEYGCLGNCGECAYRPFVMVNGTIVATEQLQQLSEAIETELKQQAAHDQALDQLPFLED